MATTQEQLTEARSAYHDLLRGRSVVSLRDQNGEVIEYTRPQAVRLKAYISELEGLVSTEALGARGPLRVVF